MALFSPANPTCERATGEIVGAAENDDAKLDYAIQTLGLAQAGSCGRSRLPESCSAVFLRPAGRNGTVSTVSTCSATTPKS
jgi:hypothetical protein